MLDITGLNSLTPYYTIEAHDVLTNPSFRVNDLAGLYVLTCKDCKRQHTVRRKADGTFHGGTVLALFDHAMSHREKKRTTTGS